MVKGLPQMSLPKEMCKECLKGKQPRNSFKSSITARSTYLLYVVHSDVCGSIEVPSLGGNRYFCTFVDEYSRMMWIYLIKHKSEVFEVFKQYKLLLKGSVVIL